MPTLISPNPRLLKEGRGHLYMAPFDANGVASLGLIDMGNLKSFAYTNKPTIDTMYSMLGGPSVVYDQAISQLDGDIDIEGTEFSAENLALIYGGTVGSFTQSSATVTAETLTTNAVLGGFYRVAKRNMTLTDLKVSSTVLVAGVPGVGDYQVINALTGLIQLNQAPVTSALMAGVTVTADYAAAEVAALDRVAVGAANLIPGSLLFVPNNSRGINQELFLYNVLFQPDAGPSFVSDKYTTWKAKATVLNDYVSAAGAHGGTAAIPFGYVMNQTAA